MQDTPSRDALEYRQSRQAHLDAMIARIESPAKVKRQLAALNRRLADREAAKHRRPAGWHKRKTVVMFGPDGKQLGQWSSVREAGRVTGIGDSTIKESIREHRPIRDGRRFVYPDAHLETFPDAMAA